MTTVLFVPFVKPFAAEPALGGRGRGPVGEIDRAGKGGRVGGGLHPALPVLEVSDVERQPEHAEEHR